MISKKRQNLTRQSKRARTDSSCWRKLPHSPMMLRLKKSTCMKFSTGEATGVSLQAGCSPEGGCLPPQDAGPSSLSLLLSPTLGQHLLGGECRVVGAEGAKDTSQRLSSETLSHSCRSISPLFPREANMSLSKT